MHRSVLLQEVVEQLAIQPTDIVVDATFGAGGHSSEIARHLDSKGALIGLDVDAAALARGEEVLKDVAPAVHLVRENFRNVDKVLDELDIKKVDVVLFDLGYSSTQLETGGRGLSFQKNEPLLMTLSSEVEEGTLTAREIVNEWTEEQIATILHGYGEERFSRRIARAVVAARAETPIETTKDLVEIISHAVPGWYRHRRISPATKTFQALRITVNDELDAITEGLEGAYRHLAPGGRIAVITFHSIEDRVVKRVFRGWKERGFGEQVPKKPTVPSREEIAGNPRARSAKLRTFRKEE
ncbi:MAG: 16S rRNA (cytosine(1402)-N(4))-methyltransferase RsmH [Candidatus Pacebacteria bacterium]|nr:16S rRNA (cytosine(1402)-N(4))-methyltransferase RsmH [Candidatus Paceibacterota bacterium]